MTTFTLNRNHTGGHMPEPSLTEFLLARITEDEAAAQHAADESLEATWELDKVHEATRLPRPMADHIARWDPARVLAECEAKRRIIELHRPERYDDVREPWCHTCGNPGGYPCGTLKLLALPYVDHPDFDETWRAE